MMLEARSLYEQKLRESYPGLDDFYIDGLCFKRLSEESGCVGALLRYEQRATNSALGAWTLLRQLQGKRPPVDGDGPVQNPGPPAPLDPWPHPWPPRVPPSEPIPENEHLEPSPHHCGAGFSPRGTSVRQEIAPAEEPPARPRAPLDPWPQPENEHLEPSPHHCGEGFSPRGASVPQETAPAEEPPAPTVGASVPPPTTAAAAGPPAPVVQAPADPPKKPVASSAAPSWLTAGGRPGVSSLRRAPNRMAPFPAVPAAARASPGRLQPGAAAAHEEVPQCQVCAAC